MPKFVELLDHRIPEGENALNTVMAEVASAGHQGAAGVVERDLEGRPVKMVLTLPDSAAAAAKAAIDANPGIPTTDAVVIPDPSFGFIADAAEGVKLATLKLTGEFATNIRGDQDIGLLFSDPGGPFGAVAKEAGYLSGDGVANDFAVSPQTGGQNPTPSTLTHLRLAITCRAEAGADLVIPANDMSIKVDGVTLPLLSPELTLPKAGVGSVFTYWIDSAGKMYPFSISENGVQLERYTAYVDAVAAGAIA
jgi:hypothetical protein